VPYARAYPRPPLGPRSFIADYRSCCAFSGTPAATGLGLVQGRLFQSVFSQTPEGGEAVFPASESNLKIRPLSLQEFHPNCSLDNRSGGAHCSAVPRDPPHQSLSRKPILSEQALPVLRRSPRTRQCPILVDLGGLRRRSPCGLTHNKRKLP